MVYFGTASLKNAQRTGTGTAQERVVRHNYFDELVRILDRGGQHIMGAYSDNFTDGGTFLERSSERIRNDFYDAVGVAEAVHLCSVKSI